MGAAGTSYNTSQSPNGEWITTFNVGIDNGGLPAGHAGFGYVDHRKMGYIGKQDGECCQ